MAGNHSQLTFPPRRKLTLTLKTRLTRLRHGILSSELNLQARPWEHPLLSPSPLLSNSLPAQVKVQRLRDCELLVRKAVLLVGRQAAELARFFDCGGGDAWGTRAGIGHVEAEGMVGGKRITTQDGEWCMMGLLS